MPQNGGKAREHQNLQGAFRVNSGNYKTKFNFLKPIFRFNPNYMKIWLESKFLPLYVLK